MSLVRDSLRTLNHLQVQTSLLKRTGLLLSTASPSDLLLAEDSSTITTEAGDHVVTENAP